MSAPKNSQIIRIVGIQTPTSGSSQLRGKDCKLITLQRNGLLDETCSEQNMKTVASTSPPTASGRSGNDLHKMPSVLSESEMQRRRNLDDGTFVIERKVPMFYGKRLRIDKSEKGLRHFSMKVSEKVKQKGKTTYNEVADELVEEFTRPIPSTSGGLTRQYDQKNVRRRVYDALNVLMAMNIISKEKKEIKWIGLPTNSLQECLNLEREKQERLQRIRQKTEQLHELIANQVAFKRLVEKNIKHEQEIGTPVPTSAIPLPFVVINTDKQTVIDCSISEDRLEYVFTFDSQYQVHDDFDILKMMGLDMGLGKEQCSPEIIKQAEKLVPEVLRKYVADVANGKIEMSMQELEEDIKITNKLIMKPVDIEKHYSTMDDDSDYRNMSEIDEQYFSE